MDWIALPSGAYVNLSRAVAVDFSERLADWEQPRAFRAIVTYAEGRNVDWPGSLRYYDADAREIQAALSANSGWRS